MSVSVLLSGGPRTGDTVVISPPWPRKFIYVDDEAGGSAKYQVTSESPAQAAYVAPGSYTEPVVGNPIVGPDGPSGPPGPPGQDGPPGPQGEGITFRGEWDIATAYDPLDSVSYGGDVYIAKALSGAQQPDQHPTVWASTKGDKGDKGDQGIQGIQGEQGVPGSPLPPRQTVTITTASLAANASESGSIPIAIGYRVLRVVTDRPARVRLYTTSAKRSADAGRSVVTDPTGDHGVVVEVVTSPTLLTIDLSPVPQGYSMEAMPTADAPYNVTNLDAVPGPVTVTLTYQQQEA